MNRTLWMATTAIFALTLSLSVSTHVEAQTITKDNNKVENVSLGEVVVTARRKAESLQNVPLAISTISGAELKQAAATSLEDVTFLTPGLTYTSGGAEAVVAPVIRGLSDTSGGLANSQNVSIFLDGIYIQNSSAIDLSLSGLERVEVVKGPVSGLYGRNAFTGAINYVTANASQTFHTADSITVGNDGRAIYDADVTGPIIPGILAGRFSGTYDELAGTFTDPNTHLRSNGHEKRDFIASLLFTPNEHITIKPVLYSGNDVFGPATQVFYPVNCATNGVSNNYCGDLGQNQIGPFVPTAVGTNESGNTRRVFSEHVDVKINYPIGTFDILAGFNQIKTHNIYDFTGSLNGIPYDIYPAAANNPFAGDPPLPGSPVLAKSFFGGHGYEHDRSVELRYDTPQSYRLRASLGGYYFYHVGYQFDSFGIDGANIPAGDALNFIAQGYVTSMGQSERPLNVSYSGTRDLSGFGNLEFDILKNLTLTGAIRYTDEEQKQSTNVTTGLRADFTSVTSNSSLTWKPNPNLTVYINGANGEKSGGFNGAALCGTDQTFAPETDYDFEGGAKGNLMGGHLRLDGNVFHTVLQGLQTAVAPLCPGAIGTVVGNLGNVEATGAELNAAYSDHGFSITAGVAYTDPRFEAMSYDINDATACSQVPACASRVSVVTINGQPTTAADLKGLSTPNASRFTFNTSVGYHHGLGFSDADGFFRLDYRFESKQFSNVTNFAYYGPRNVINLHAGFTVKNVTLEGIILNATNDRTPLASAYNAQLNTFDAPPNGYYGINWNALSYLPDPRTYAVKISYRY